ncbi:phosphohistidine phosphatase SixA [Desulfosarcina widdelii]|uniref:Phosphohistidine phosphatase SixA n=1 Tax=Desulfosarcina widdelii TaxID=947919 RepID=A0A5K7YYU0_9BACT|nr:phosphohistidine phosphatase SixA [Desulfosarcina widdelii]BBO73595.1 phosphohistidine phosphatase SixA [Desulfosarcina widdelii]
MALYVVQHGKSLPKADDPEKGLSEEGIRETERIANVARGYGVTVSVIVHSGKKRARQTAERMGAALCPDQEIQTRSGMNPLDDVAAFVRDLPLDQNIMLVGHLPFLEKLIGLLVCSDATRTVFKLQNSGIVCLDEASDIDNAVIRWALMPNVG